MCSSLLPGGDVLDDVAALVAERNRIDARLARAVRAAEVSQAPERDGQRSMASWLRGHCRLSGSEALRVVTNGRAMECLPALAEGADAGLVAAGQVAEAARAVTPRRLAAARAQDVDLAVVDAVVTGVAVERPHADLVEVVARYLLGLEPDGPEPDPSEGRSLTVSKHADGSLSIRGHLDAVGGEKVQAALEAHVQADRPAGDERTRAQRQGDALVQLADNALSTGAVPVLRTVRPHVAVRIDLDDLASGEGTATTGSGAVISAARARWLACDGGIARVVFGPDGVPLDVGREQRLVSGSLRRAVEARDGGCVFAGCDAPSHWADVHHPATSRGPRRACESWGGGGPYTHQGPPRIQGRATTGWPMAHLATRRIGDHHPGTTGTNGGPDPVLGASGRRPGEPGAGVTVGAAGGPYAGLP